MNTAKSYEQFDAERAALIDKLKADIKTAYTANDQVALASLHRKAKVILQVLQNNIANLEALKNSGEEIM
jgi:hypothetical protein